MGTQPLHGTGLLEDRFIKHTTIMDTNDSVDQVPFDIAKARSHYDAKHVSSQKMLNRLEKDCQIYSQQKSQKKIHYLVGLSSLKECINVTNPKLDDGNSLNSVKTTIQNLLKKRKEKDTVTSTKLIEILFYLTSLETIVANNDVQKEGKETKQNETTSSDEIQRCTLRLERYVDSCTG